ncbi:MAG TPA: hypothetical protein VNO50_03540 [Pyrinomonadaceae bacterium]|nr:hypothetical protein [Pyrinomonadaceae bacterium]
MNPRHLPLILVLILRLSTSPAISSNFISQPHTTVIQAIRQQYAAINKRVGRYKRVKKELSGFSLEGGDLTAYFDGPAIVKVVANHYGEGGRAFEEYYYSKGNLIFVYRKDFTYNRPLSGKVVKTIENRFYFHDDRLIRWIGETEKQVAVGSPEFLEQQKDYLESSRKFVSGARSKNSTIEAECADC